MARIVRASSANAVPEAAEQLSAGRLVAIPTDTVYGLAACVSHPDGPSRLFGVKGRPREVGLPVLVASLDQAASLVSSLPASAARLAASFWPGGLTVVMERNARFTVDLGGDGATVGVRYPDHPVPVSLCRAVGPLAATSANLHGAPTPSTAAGVEGVFGERVALVLDGGVCDGSASTVVDCTTPEPVCLRQGSIPWSEIVRALEGSA